MTAAAGRADSTAMTIEIVFWLSLLLFVYTNVGYPVLLGLWARWRARPARRGDGLPTLTVLVVACDEADRIETRIANLLALDYPRDRLEIMVASDGSGDGTVERARAYEPSGVRVFAFPVRRGKPAVLDELVPRARGELVVLADARQRFEPGTLRALAAQFDDPAVGAASGELLLEAGGQGAVGQGVGFYWRFEKWIRRQEALVDSTVGATGAVYAIRRELFAPIPPDTILDDVLIPLRIVRRGYRVVFVPEARAHDRPPATAAQEFGRKARTIAGNFQLFARERWLLDPFRNRLWVQTLSHKGLRLLTPVLLLACLQANVLLAGSAFYACTLAAQVVFYLLAVSGCLLRNNRGRSPVLSVPYTICLLSWATVVAFLRFATGGQSVTWQRAPARAAEAPAQETAGQPWPSGRVRAVP